MARLFLSKGANPNARSVIGRTPLFSAVVDSQVNMVRLLVDNGADVNARDDRGTAVLRLAHNREIRRILIEHGARE
jgi:ankyrin repeat protein